MVLYCDSEVLSYLRSIVIMYKSETLIKTCIELYCIVLYKDNITAILVGVVNVLCGGVNSLINQSQCNMHITFIYLTLFLLNTSCHVLANSVDPDQLA